MDHKKSGTCPTQIDTTMASELLASGCKLVPNYVAKCHLSSATFETLKARLNAHARPFLHSVCKLFFLPHTRFSNVPSRFLTFLCSFTISYSSSSRHLLSSCCCHFSFFFSSDFSNRSLRVLTFNNLSWLTGRDLLFLRKDTLVAPHRPQLWEYTLAVRVLKASSTISFPSFNIKSKCDPHTFKSSK